MKADLHYHGLIGFQPQWLKLQGCQSKNLAQLILEAALARNIDILAITSENFTIGREDPIHNRFYRLTREAINLPSSYSHDLLGKNTLVLEKKNQGRVIILNGQTAIVEERGTRYDHLVVGGNHVPAKWNFEDVINFCYDEGLLNFLEHPVLENHFGVGLQRAEELLTKYRSRLTGIEGHNSQMIVNPRFSHLPIIGHYNKDVNALAMRIAGETDSAAIATSDGHLIEDAGLSYIETPDLDTSSEARLLSSLRNRILARQFTRHAQYKDVVGWLNWTAKSAIGVRLYPEVR